MTTTELVMDGLGFPESTRWWDCRVWVDPLGEALDDERDLELPEPRCSNR